MDAVSYRYGELFCGPGGLSLGAIQSQVAVDGVTHRIRHTWATDLDSDSCDTYRMNICPDHPDSVICADVSELDVSSLPPIDILAFGFPCNDFSIVGETRGMDGKFGMLYKYGVKVLELHKPMAFVAENVSGISGANGGKAWEMIQRDLENAGPGYDLTVNHYYFEEYGVPQMRHRYIIVGIRKDLGFEFPIPKPTTKDSPSTCRQAIEDPPIPPEATHNEIRELAPQVQERLSFIGPGENAWSEKIPSHLRLNVKGAFLSNIYRRMHPDLPAYTITGSGGGGTHGYHWSENRALTNRERARIQTFPDDFEFFGGAMSVRKQIGMAVPPLAAKMIFSAVLETLSEGEIFNSEVKEMITGGLYEHALLAPERKGADTLYIVSGYASATFVFKHLRELEHAKVNLIIGMLGTRDHIAFLEIMRMYEGRFCAYYLESPPPVHSKMFAWYAGDDPAFGFAGSANYSQSGFDEHKQVNQLSPVNPIEIKLFYDDLLTRSIPINDFEFEDEVVPIAGDDARPGGLVWVTEGETVTISFLGSRGDLPEKSGLNWGMPDGTSRRPYRELGDRASYDQAYIRIPRGAQYEGFLPNKGCTFSLITDDGKSLDCTVQQDSRKAVSTTYDNSELGRYFRRRLGVELGAPVQKDDLVNYGRTDFTLRKIDEETFFLDFSI